MRFASLTASAVLVFLSASMAQTVITVSPFDANVRTVDVPTGMTISSIPMTSTAGSIIRGTGLARHPVTSVVYAIVQIPGAIGHHLGTLDTVTGVLTAIGDTNDRFAAITFDSAGNLFGVTGDGGVRPEQLFIIDPATALTVGVGPLGNGNDGEALAFNPMDGLLYHASGVGTLNTNEIFETVDPATAATTNIPQTGFDYDGLRALMYRPATNDFLFSEGGFQFGTISTTGVTALLSPLDHLPKGIISTVPPTYPGTGEDLIMQVTLSSGLQTPQGVHPVSPGDGISIATVSPATTFDGTPLFVLGEIFNTGSPPAPAFPGIVVSGNPATVFLLFGGPIPGLGQPLTLPAGPGGFQFSFPYSGGFSGFSLMVQSLVTTGTAANGIFASTDGNEFQLN